MSNDKAKEGFASLRKNYGKYLNPYPDGSAYYFEFERGWVQALKRCSESELRDLETTGAEIERENTANERKKIGLNNAAYAATKGR